MAENKTQSASNNKQKIMGAVFVIILFVIIWQAWGLFGGSSAAPAVAPAPTSVDNAAQMSLPQSATTSVTTTTTGPANPAIKMQAAAPPPPAAPITTRESEILRLQHEAQAKYLAAIDSLQMLKVEREIAETNQAIATAKLAKVKAEKDVLDLFTRPTPGAVPTSSYAASLVSPVTSGVAVQGATALMGEPVPPSYIVLSVSYVNKRWAAVIGNQGKLFNVSIGDILPPDGSVIVSIDRTGVVLRKDDEKKKVSLVPVI